MKAAPTGMRSLSAETRAMAAGILIRLILIRRISLIMEVHRLRSWFVSKMKISSTIWLILGIYQCVIGLPLIMFFGYGLTTIGLGVWNIIQSQKKKKMAEQYYQNPTGIVAAMESSQTLVIVFLLLNVFFGGFLGVAGAIYDLTIISFVTSNRQAFDAMGRQNYTAGGYNVYR